MFTILSYQVESMSLILSKAIIAYKSYHSPIKLRVNTFAGAAKMATSCVQLEQTWLGTAKTPRLQPIKI